MTKKEKLQEKTFEELQKQVEELRENLHKFRFGLSHSKTRDIKSGRNLRKDIARNLTAMKVVKKNK
jgi:ribosomal protein L29